LPPTPSSASATPRPPRGALIALIVVSLAIPAAILAFVWRADGGSKRADPTTAGTIPGTPQKAKIGSLAPDFTLPALDGGNVTLSKLRGKPVVLSFFASWCNPCEKDMPVLERVHNNQRDNVKVIGVNYKDFKGDTSDFVKRLGTTFPALIEDATENPVAKRYDVNAMPDTVLIDAQGVVRDRIFGETNTADLQARIDKLLAG
jgi:cytochrome c biogenesis protein CcmG/thiol:disulfide interchange protein DsbE